MYILNLDSKKELTEQMTSELAEEEEEEEPEPGSPPPAKRRKELKTATRNKKIYLK